jgi:hypothetical protein
MYPAGLMSSGMRLDLAAAEGASAERMLLAGCARVSIPRASTRSQLHGAQSPVSLARSPSLVEGMRRQVDRLVEEAVLDHEVDLRLGRLKFQVVAESWQL